MYVPMLNLKGSKTKYRKYVRRGIRMREPKFKELRESMSDRQARNAREYKYVCHQVMVWPPFGSAWRNEWSM